MSDRRSDPGRQPTLRLRRPGRGSGGRPRECGRAAARLGKLDWIFGVRGLAADFVRAAIEGGHPENRAQFFESSEEAGKFLEQFITRGDLLLVKGSRGVKMEKILEAIEARHPRVVATKAPETLGVGPKVRR